MRRSSANCTDSLSLALCVSVCNSPLAKYRHSPSPPSATYGDCSSSRSSSHFSPSGALVLYSTPTPTAFANVFVAAVRTFCRSPLLFAWLIGRVKKNYCTHRKWQLPISCVLSRMKFILHESVIVASTNIHCVRIDAICCNSELPMFHRSMSRRDERGRELQ